MFEAIQNANWDQQFTPKEAAGIRYAEILTARPSEVQEADIDDLRNAGFDDGEILEVNQVVSYFAYANRMVLGLGVNTDGDVLDLSPLPGESGDWSHR